MEVADEPTGRNTRRKTRTRAALVRAAQQILAEGGADSASIQAIAERADVGFGSFYNHFQSKTELFATAYAEAFQAYVAWRDAQIPAGTDPVARFVMSVRLTGRLGLLRPEIARVLTSRLAEAAPGEHGPAGPGLRVAILDALAALNPGRVEPTDTEVTVIAAAGAIDAILRATAHRPAREHARLADSLARDLLRMLGADDDRSAALLAEPCPPATAPGEDH
ncbi:TetR family transcriptional regulator [Micromonospora sp. Llam0]|nr:TetR family transcriptional regulator [Micromonospora sp. Llam0]